MTRCYHVTSSLNRESIFRYGLDCLRMGAAPGIAGSAAPEQQGCFLVLDRHTADWFVRLNNTGGPVDVWAVEGVDEATLVESPEGYLYLPGVIPARLLRLVREDLPEAGP